MPKPHFGPDDLVDPDAPEDEQRVRPDHPAVRDRSYEVSRSRQEIDLWKGSLISEPLTPWDGYAPGEVPEDAEPGPQLRLFIKERPRGPGYVCDFTYRSRDLPVVVYGVLVNEGRGLVVNELELWRSFTKPWGYWDRWSDFVDADGWAAEQRREAEENRRWDEAERAAGREPEPEPAPAPFPGITTSLLRRIPLGEIVAVAQAELAGSDWRQEGIRVLPGPPVAADDLPEPTLAALETAESLAAPARRGRPMLSDEHLAQVAYRYLAEASSGPGLIRRLAVEFDRPEPTVKDWIRQARRRGFLSPATSGRRGAAPGPRLPVGSASATSGRP